MKEKKQLIMSINKPVFIHKNGGSMTIAVCTYAIPWTNITNVPICPSVLNKVEKISKFLPGTHIEFNMNENNPAWIFKVYGKTICHANDIPDKTIGDRIAKAKAFAKACTIGIAISEAAINGLEEELKRNITIFKSWYNKEHRIIMNA